MKLAPSVLLVALTACVDEPAAVDATARSSQDALDLVALEGDWVETSSDPGCMGCRLDHHLALVGDTRIDDAISVRSPAGETCAMKRGYLFTGALVDYAFLASDCVWGPKGIVFEGYARWALLGGDQLEVSERAPEGLAPTRWTRTQ